MIFFYKAVILLILIFASNNAKAVDELNITRIKQNVEAKESELNQISQEYDKIQNDINKKVAQLSVLRERAKNLELELKIVSEELIKLQQEISDNEERKDELGELSKERIKNLFFQKRKKQLRLLSLINRENYLRDVFFLAKVDSHDKDLLTRLSEFSLIQKAKEDELKTLLSNQDLLKDKLSIEEKAVSAGINEEVKLRAELKQKKDQIENTLSKLRAEALRLEMVIKSLTGAEKKRKDNKNDLVKKYGKADIDNGIQGNGLVRGMLALPIHAQVYRPYGTHIVKGFRELVTSKGIEFSQSSSGKPVFVVSDGRVMYLGEMPAYGKVMIISHGKRYYSLYGKLSTTLVTVGDKVQKGTQIASADSGFYFEVRKQGQSINPMTFYPKGFN